MMAKKLRKPHQWNGSFLQQRREALRLTRPQLATRSGVNWRSIECYEKGVREPGDDVRAKLARGLGCSVQDLQRKVVVT